MNLKFKLYCFYVLFWHQEKQYNTTIEEKCKFSDKVTVFFSFHFLLEFSELYLQLNSNPKPNKVKLLINAIINLI